MVKKILEFFPGLYVILILLGYLNLEGYYAYFDIKIYNFISVGEVVLLFMPIIIQVLLIISLVFIFALIGRTGRNSTKESDDFEDMKFWFEEIFITRDWLTKRSFFKKTVDLFFGLLALIIRIGATVFILFLLFMLLRAVYLRQDTVYNYRTVAIMVVILNMGYFLPLLSKFIRHVLRIMGRTQWLNGYGTQVIIFIIAYFIFNFYSNYASSLSVLQGHPYYTFEAKDNDIDYITNDTLVFIGSTQNFVFLRNLQDSTNIFIRTDKLISYKIKRIKKEGIIKKDSPAFSPFGQVLGFRDLTLRDSQRSRNRGGCPAQTGFRPTG